MPGPLSPVTVQRGLQISRSSLSSQWFDIGCEGKKCDECAELFERSVYLDEEGFVEPCYYIALYDAKFMEEQKCKCIIALADIIRDNVNGNNIIYNGTEMYN